MRELFINFVIDNGRILSVMNRNLISTLLEMDKFLRNLF